MDYLSSSIFDPLCPQINESLLHNDSIIPDFIPSLTQLQVEGDQILPTFESTNDVHYDIFNQIPTFIEDPLRKTNHTIVQSKKRSLSSDPRTNHFHIIAPTSGSLCTKKSTDVNLEEGNEKSCNEKKKKQKISHREVERQRRLEMSLLHTSLKTLLPQEYTKGKRSISDHLAETVKYINQMQRKMKVLIDKRDGLRKEVSSTFKEQKQEHEVIVNVFKDECFEIIVSTHCGDDNNGEQELPLSKVLQCLIQEGLDVVNSISKRVNDKFVHSIHAQIGDKGSKAIDAANLKQKLANIQR